MPRKQKVQAMAPKAQEQKAQEQKPQNQKIQGQGSADPKPQEGSHQNGPSKSLEFKPLLGEQGRNYLYKQLTQVDPRHVSQNIQKECGLQDQQCLSLVQLLDQMDVPRRLQYKQILESAVEYLLEQVPFLSQDILRELLESSFEYVSYQELRRIPIKVLEHIQPVPQIFLQQLSSNQEIFTELPTQIKREVLKLDQTLLGQRLVVYIYQYLQDDTNVTSTLLMDFMLRQKMQQTLRKQERQKQDALNSIMEIIGKSRIIYAGFLNLLVSEIMKSVKNGTSMPAAMICMLRSQILMSMHDQGSNEVCNSDPSYQLAWILDASLKDKLQQTERLKEIEAYFQDHDPKDSQPVQLKKLQKKGTTKQQIKQIYDENVIDDDNYDVSDSIPVQNILCSSAIILRDPHILNMLVLKVLSLLNVCIDQSTLPKNNSAVTFTTRLIVMAMRYNVFLEKDPVYFPQPPKILIHELFPIFVSLIVDIKIRKYLKTKNKDQVEKEVKLKPQLQDDKYEEIQQIMQKESSAVFISMGFVVYCNFLQDFQALNTVVKSIIKYAQNYKSEQEVYQDQADWWGPFGFTLAKQLQGALVREKNNSEQQTHPQPPNQDPSNGSKKVTSEWFNADFHSSVVQEILANVVNIHPYIHQQVLSYLQELIDPLGHEQVIQFVELIRLKFQAAPGFSSYANQNNIYNKLGWNIFTPEKNSVEDQSVYIKRLQQSYSQLENAIKQRSKSEEFYLQTPWVST